MPERRHPIPVVGQKFSGWTVLGRGPNMGWLCRCECGKEQELQEHGLRRSKNGCQDCFIAAASRGYQHVPTRLRVKLRSAISAAISRCTNPTDRAWKWYGARGIKVHQAWIENRDEFFDYLLTLPGHNNLNLTLDRTNNSRGYEPGNIRFATMSQQIKNQRKLPGRKCSKRAIEKNLTVPPEIRKAIKAMYVPFKVPLRVVAERYGVNIQMVHAIVTRKGRFDQMAATGVTK